MDTHPCNLLTILFADIAGSTLRPSDAPLIDQERFPICIRAALDRNGVDGRAAGQ